MSPYTLHSALTRECAAGRGGLREVGVSHDALQKAVDKQTPDVAPIDMNDQGDIIDQQKRVCCVCLLCDEQMLRCRNGLSAAAVHPEVT